MAGIKEIRTKIKSVQNTRKITKAMEMVAASKMRKAQDRMRAGRPYTKKVREIAMHMMQTNPDYSHPFLEERKEIKSVGVVLVTTDKGLCGGLNTNITRLVLNRLKEFESQGINVQATAFGNKGLGFLTRLGVHLVSQQVNLGDKPNLEALIGALKVQLDDYINGKIDALYIATSAFVNTMRQVPTFVRILPLPDGLADPFATEETLLKNDQEKSNYTWDYIFEPSAKEVIDNLLHRYIEGVVYQAVAENMASEQSARMVAMKAASDNAKKVIGDLQLVYNKTRQAAITKEISEIVGGAAAV
ncbi:F0F1 ATP synthase subunit gamma [Pelistega sp. NLN82]|uniref:ATP synthase gamma chain n=1 Tax=Pelistega ratti TaxID=2652177 RepID=A0A6L9Y6U2_9BURK|nr:F0F1 ATP synthase subunit gamma [Pelistega ratti]NEN76036.1 F0F1 ATP synthase subunit gamma [Pelistega ratti]